MPTSTESVVFFPSDDRSSRGAAIGRAIASMVLVSAAFTSPALASFHLWRITEVFSDATGTIQFIQFHEGSGSNGENELAGVTLEGTSEFTFPADLPSTATASAYFLVATSGYAALPGAVQPEPGYIIPSGFLSLAGGTLTYASGFDQIFYPALPTDGITALNRQGSPIPNVETNFSGMTGSVVVVPAPGAIVLAPLPVFVFGRRKR